VVEVSIKPYILSSKQRINYAFYLSKSRVAFKDLLILWLGLGRYIIGKRILVLFLFPFPPLLKRLSYSSPFAPLILRFR